jgi:hypothetical protein
MMEEKSTATDLVFESSFFMAEDMLRTTGESVKEIIRNGRILYGISAALTQVKKIAQIESLSKACTAIAKIHEKSIASIASSMSKMEDNSQIVEILNELDMDNFWNEGSDEDDEQSDP